MAAWQEEYKRKLVSAEEAAKLIKSGDKLFLGILPEANDILYAIAARRDELENVELNMYSVQTDCGWYDPGWQNSFSLNLQYVCALTRPRMDDKTADFTPAGLFLDFKPHRDLRPDRRQFDYLITPVSPPDRFGFCSFGHGIWRKKEAAKYCKGVIAEVDRRMIRTYGDNLIHVSEIDHFVESTASEPIQPLFKMEMEPGMKEAAENVASLIHDGDTIQTGVGSIVGNLVSLGVLDDKHDLGLHTEYTTVGLVELMEKGIINGRRKNLHPGKAVATGIWPYEGALEFVNENPMFELYGTEYVNDIRTVSSNDNMVAINQAMAVDLTGQATAHSIGPRIYSGVGGQLEFHIGAIMSRGGRGITALRSTARGGTISTIVPQLERGTHVAIPNIFVDYVVTEYGIASLQRKTLRERANELIAIAHPDFRGELRKEAQRLLYA